MDYTDLNSCIENYNDLSKEFKELENANKEYLTKLEELGELQSKCVKEISHQRYRLDIISKSLRKFRLKNEEKADAKKLRDDIEKRHHHLCEMEHCLPKPNGTYLKIILGNVNVSILNKNDKFKYKDEYEKFKVYLSVIGFALSVINLSTNFRVLELLFMFLLVWYYCTLTIRESILKVNGSKIKGWWRAHHFISTVVSGVLLIWPTSTTWYHFRPQFMVFNVYISFVQFLQFKYQQGVLYRLKALGERHNMDITIEGFHSWMWRGLSFLLPFLYAGYLFQLYNAYTLYTLVNHPDTSWQIPVLAALFFTLFLGNTVTTSIVIRQKFHEKYGAYIYDYTTSSSHKRHKSDEANQHKSD
ncbi:transmembrane protein 120 homolog isoform X2 [Nilaparvata lugens]|uniref:transmembrane protein 120 homolog isoform X1 n=1 Tax=Nilaparvata lugens TaxID=108931 RepID=UPI00193E4C73|nr:transmembrane protein 120 homolog isoform X1 [Nilaparvata lugens]XP_039292650.1 transmembrane protein 120 homolog isoform X2 [Nilaparvata lugens]